MAYQSDGTSMAFWQFRHRQAHHERLVAGGMQEAQKILPRDPGRHGVDQRMKVHPLVCHQVGVEYHGHLPGQVVDDGEGRYRAGLDAEARPQLLSRTEREATRGADCHMGPFKVDGGLVPGGDEEVAAFLVLDEEVLRVSPRNGGLDRSRFRDREHGGVLDGLGADAERIQMRQERMRREMGHDFELRFRGVLEGGRTRLKTERVNRWGRMARSVPSPWAAWPGGESLLQCESIWGK